MIIVRLPDIGPLLIQVGDDVSDAYCSNLKEILINRPKSKLALALIATAFAATAFAQQPRAGGGVAVTSEPGAAAAVCCREDRPPRWRASTSAPRATAVVLKGPEGNVVDVVTVAGDEVRNFDQIKLGDLVVVRYAEALTLELRKTKTGAGGVSVNEGAALAEPGERPAAAGARQISAIATVTAVDQKKSTITLKGPRGNVVTLNVHNPDQFKIVKKGDQVEVTYTEALALSVEPAAR